MCVQGNVMINTANAYQSTTGVSSPTLQSCVPPRNTQRHKIKAPLESISRTILHIPGITVDRRPDGALAVYATQNTWSRAARRRALRGEEAQGQPSPFVCGVSFPDADEVVFEWIRGGDGELFSSFTSHVMRCSST